MLYIVATPIGHLKDITLRALEVLKEADVIACEDTRHTGILLNHYQIKKPLLSFHSHSGQTKVDTIVEHLKASHKVALVSDAGTPGISDPGFRVIQAALEEGIPVIPIPGPSAFLTALSGAGLPTDKFLYLGFLPIKKGRQRILGEIAEAKYTVVFYESPHRLIRTLHELTQVLSPTAQVVIGKELTKIYETFYRGTAAEILSQLAHKKPKGEYVILVNN